MKNVLNDHPEYISGEGVHMCLGKVLDITHDSKEEVLSQLMTSSILGFPMNVCNLRRSIRA